MFIVSQLGQWIAYCPECRATHISNDDGVTWSLLKEIQPNHPNPYFTKEMEIIRTLHSIKELSVAYDELEVQFDDCINGCHITAFKSDSFTRKLLELIEDELLK